MTQFLYFVIFPHWHFLKSPLGAHELIPNQPIQLIENQKQSSALLSILQTFPHSPIADIPQFQTLLGKVQGSKSIFPSHR